LALVPPGIEDWFIIGFPLLLGLAFILLPFIAPTGERSPMRRPWAVGIVGFSFVAIGSLVVAGYQAPWSPNFNPQPLPAAVTENLAGNAAQGAQLFQTQGCINCHLIAGDGGRRGPDLTAVGSRVSADQLTTRILNGGVNMPAYSDKLAADQVRALVTFLSQLK